MRHVPLRRPKADTKGRLKTGFPLFQTASALRQAS